MSQHTVCWLQPLREAVYFNIFDLANPLITYF